jgi:hypothetical protein
VAFRECAVIAARSERTRVIADVAWLGGLVQLVMGSALLAGPEAPVVAATLAIIGGATAMLAGTLVLLGAQASWTVATIAFVLSFGAAGYAAWVAAPYWPGALVIGVLALGGLVAEWSPRRTTPAELPSGANGG